MNPLNNHLENPEEEEEKQEQQDQEPEQDQQLQLPLQRDETPIGQKQQRTPNSSVRSPSSQSTPKNKPSSSFSARTEGVHNLDIMGDRFKMNYPTPTNRYQTRLGGCATVLITLLAIGALILISSQYFDTTSPIVTTSKEPSRSGQSFNIYAKDLLSGITVSFFNIFEPNKMGNFMTVKAQIIKKTYNRENSAYDFDFSKGFDFIPCEQIRDPTTIRMIRRTAPDSDIRLLLCPNFKQANNKIFLSKDPQNLSSSHLVIKVYPCSLPDQTQCFPFQKVHGSQVNFGAMSHLLSPSNFENPVEFLCGF